MYLVRFSVNGNDKNMVFKGRVSGALVFFTKIQKQRPLIRHVSVNGTTLPTRGFINLMLQMYKKINEDKK